MADHIRVTASSQVRKMPTYLGDKIQNEIVSLLAKEIQNLVLHICKQNKYFSIILDCTPDIAHTEQISTVKPA